jgi:hypothetical protein
LYNDKGSAIKVMDDILIRDSFETYGHFKERIENLKSINIGKAEILVNTYDKQSGICYINVEFYKWKSIGRINYSYLYFVLPDKEFDFIKCLNDRYTIRANFKVVGEKIYIDEESVEICIDDMELKVNIISFLKEPFQNCNEFKGLITNIKDMPLGKVTLEKENYDINTGTFKIKVDFDTFKEVNFPNINLFYISINKEEVGEFYENNNSCTLYGGLTYINDKIFIDTERMYLLWQENKIRINVVLFDNSYFDTSEEYKNQIKNLNLLCAGKASLIVDKYDNVEETLPLNIEWEDWVKEYALNLKASYIESDARLSKNLYESSDKYSVYVTIKYENNNIFIEKVKMINFNGDMEIKFKNIEVKDIEETADKTISENDLAIVDVVAYDTNNDDDYAINEKFDFIDGIALMKVNGNYTYIDEQGKRLGLINNRLMRFIDSKGKYGYMDKEHRITIIKPYFDYIGSFNDNVAKININDKWGYINEEGAIIISPAYEFARDFHDGFAAVKVKALIGSKWGYINKQGEMVIKPKFDEVGEFCNGVARVKFKSIIKGIKDGVVYKNGEFHDYVKM